MDNESKPMDAYETVLADLRAQREKIDHAIAVLEALRSGGSPFTQGSFATTNTPHHASGAKGSQSALGPGAFLGMTIVDAAMKLLRHERRQLTNAELCEKLTAGGLVLGSVDKLNTVGSVMNRRFQQQGDVVRVGRGTWGLKEWYPNRSFKSVKGGEDVADAAPAPETPPPAPEPASGQFAEVPPWRRQPMPEPNITDEEDPPF